MRDDPIKHSGINSYHLEAPPLPTISYALDWTRGML